MEIWGFEGSGVRLILSSLMQVKHNLRVPWAHHCDAPTHPSLVWRSLILLPGRGRGTDRVSLMFVNFRGANTPLTLGDSDHTKCSLAKLIYKVPENFDPLLLVSAELAGHCAPLA